MPGVPAPDLRNISGVAPRSDNRGSETDVLGLGASDDLSEVVAKPGPALGTEKTAPIYELLVRDKSQGATWTYSAGKHTGQCNQIYQISKAAISSLIVH